MIGEVDPFSDLAMCYGIRMIFFVGPLKDPLNYKVDVFSIGLLCSNLLRVNLAFVGTTLCGINTFNFVETLGKHFTKVQDLFVSFVSDCLLSTFVFWTPPVCQYYFKFFFVTIAIMTLSYYKKEQNNMCQLL